MVFAARSARAPIKYQAFVGGDWVDAASGATFESEDPFSGDVWAVLPRCGAADVDRAVEAADKAFFSGAWPALTASARGQLIYKLGDLIAEKA
jgi:aldehyde dehydrogenase (NAD+)